MRWVINLNRFFFKFNQVESKHHRIHIELKKNATFISAQEYTGLTRVVKFSLPVSFNISFYSKFNINENTIQRIHCFPLSLYIYIYISLYNTILCTFPFSKTPNDINPLFLYIHIYASHHNQIYDSRTLYRRFNALRRWSGIRRSANHRRWLVTKSIRAWCLRLRICRWTCVGHRQADWYAESIHS